MSNGEIGENFLLAKFLSYTVYLCDDLSLLGEPEQAAHWFTNWSLYKAGFVTHK